jgi:glutathione synthase
MRIAFIVDPLDVLKPYKDSSIAMMHAAQAAGHSVCTIQQPSIHWTTQHGVCAEAPASCSSIRTRRTGMSRARA